MTEIILKFPARNVAPLRCVWMETGDPSHPLACKWVRREKSSEVLSMDSSERHLCRLCA